MKKALLYFIVFATAGLTFANTPQRDFNVKVATSSINLDIVQPSSTNDAVANDEWILIGTGVYTDVVISSISGTRPIALSVEFEQNASDPNTYRIRAPYANWNVKGSEKLVTYHPEKATPMIVHVVDDKYAWFESFNTGFYIDTADDIGPIVGEVTVCQVAESLINANGCDAVVLSAPSTLCTYVDGTMTLTSECTYETSSGTVTTLSNVRIDVAGEPMWRGNRSGEFCVQLPTAKDLNPNMKWNTLEGKAKFTDAFTSLFAYQDEPVYPIFEVEIQQNEADPTIFRLVNPYAQWESSYSSYDFKYDSSNNYYMIIYTFPEHNLACTNTFQTGINVKIRESEDTAVENDFEMFGVQNQAYYFYESYASLFGWYLSDVAEEFPYMLGNYNDGVITCPAYYEDEYSGQIMEFPTFTGWTGSYREATDNGYTYVVNKMGNFKVILPGAKEPDSSIDNITIEDKTAVEYYNLQGIRLEKPQPGTLVIERRGTQTVKRVYN